MTIDTPIYQQLDMFWSSHENKHNLQLLVRDTVRNEQYVNTTITTIYVVVDDDVVSAKANVGAEIPELSSWMEEEDIRIVMHGEWGCACKIVPESYRSFQRYRHFCVTATLCPIPSKPRVEGHLAAVWHWRKAAHASTASYTFSQHGAPLVNTVMQPQIPTT